MNWEEFGSGHGLLEIHAVFSWKDRKTHRTTKILSSTVTELQMEATNHGLPNTIPKCSVDNVAFY
jgi:hypothetical protein